MKQHNDLTKTLRWIAANDEDVFNADTANLAVAALEKMGDEIDYLKKHLEIEKDHSAQMERERDANPTMKHLLERCQRIERERDAAVADLRKSRLPCSVCAHSIHQTGIPCDERPDRPADGSCDFVWRGIQGEGKER